MQNLYQPFAHQKNQEINKMNTSGSFSTITVPDPFDGSADIRLKHMGILDSEGRVRMQVITAFSRIFTGLFFDDLLGIHKTGEMLTIFETFKAL